MIRQSYTAVVDRNRTFEGPFSSEPYECGWASEAVFFFRLLPDGNGKLQVEGDIAGTEVRVQISPDGIRWVDEGSSFTLSGGEVDFVKVRHFGNYLRLAGTLPEGTKARVLVALHLKE